MTSIDKYDIILIGVYEIRKERSAEETPMFFSSRKRSSQNRSRLFLRSCTTFARR